MEVKCRYIWPYILYQIYVIFFVWKIFQRKDKRAFVSAVRYTAGIKDSIHLTDKPIQEALYLNSESNRYWASKVQKHSVFLVCGRVGCFFFCDNASYFCFRKNENSYSLWTLSCTIPLFLSELLCIKYSTHVTDKKHCNNKMKVLPEKHLSITDQIFYLMT